jgi:hypothetical protein
MVSWLSEDISKLNFSNRMHEINIVKYGERMESNRLDGEGPKRLIAQIGGGSFH